MVDVPHLRAVPADGLSAADAMPDLDSLFRTYSGYVARIAFRILGRADDVDDVVQDVFLAAAKGLSKVREVEALKGWLATITVRQSKRRLRRRKARQFFRLESVSDQSDYLPRPASAEQVSMLSDVGRVLDTLPTESRVAWVLYHLEDEPLETVAEYCGISRATAHRRLTHARKVLREAFDD